MFQELLRRCFDYDAATGQLINKKNRGSKGKKGKVAGCPDRRGYISVGAFGRMYRAHRLIYAWHYGDFDNSLLVDHINGDPSDNRIENLRLVTEMENHRNRRMGDNNTHGVFGIHQNKRCSTWYSTIYDKNKIIYLGSYPSKELAIEARKAAEKEFGYHENHGKPLVRKRLPKATVVPLKKAS